MTHNCMCISHIKMLPRPLSRCLEDIKRWLSTNKLKLNPDKTEFIVFGSKSHREKLNHSFPVNILSKLILPVDAVRNLGVWFDSDFSFSWHVMKVCKGLFCSCPGSDT